MSWKKCKKVKQFVDYDLCNKDERKKDAADDSETVFLSICNSFLETCPPFKIQTQYCFLTEPTKKTQTEKKTRTIFQAVSKNDPQIAA